MRQPLLDVLRDRLVTLEDHDRVAALLAAVELHGGDVDVPLHERRRHGSNMAGRVLIVDNERVVLTGKVRLDTVDGADADAPAADALGHDVQRAALGARELQARGVRVRVAQLHVPERERQPLLRRDGKAARNAQIVRLHTEQARDQRAVRAVAMTGQGEAAVQRNVRVQLHYLILIGREVYRSFQLKSGVNTGVPFNVNSHPLFWIFPAFTYR